MEAFADERRDALLLLDKWTAIRWGDDNVAWVVYYPDEFVDLWVKSEAVKRRLRPDQAEEYRKSFAGELRTGSATAVLFSVHAFGQSSVSIAPLAKNIALIDSSGRRIPPMVFEKKLDSPLNGLVQGLVFFPRQEDDNFAIAVKGLVAEGETIFSFTRPNGAGSASIETSSPRAVGTKGKTPSLEVKETIVRIPTAAKQPERPTPPAIPKKDESPAEFSTEGETFQPTPPPAEVPASNLRASSDETPKEAEAESRREPRPNPKQALEIFLRAWIEGDSDKMYSLLSTDSRQRISKELFERNTMSDGFRRGLRGGYKVDWYGDSAKVTVSKKILFIKTLDSKNFNFSEEDGSSRVSW
jgi:hypothetical protein